MNSTSNQAPGAGPAPNEPVRYESGKGCLFMAIAGLICVAVAVAAIMMFSHFEPT